MQKLYIKIAQHTLLIILLWFQNIFGSYFSQSFNRRSGSNSKIIAHFWSNLLIQIYHHITCKIHSKRRILLINICNYNCTHIFPLIWHLEDLLLISLISWHAQCLIIKESQQFSLTRIFFFLQKITWQITYSSFTS